MKVLTFVNYYLPGFRGGGPIRSVANLVAHLGREFEFRIVTTDRDFQDTHAYAGVVPGEWRPVGDAEVLYMPDERMTLWGIRQLLRGADCDVIYLNSFFHPRYTIPILLLRQLRMIPDKAVVLAPRGELSPGALALKKWKKRLFITLARRIGLYHGVLWQASSIHEEADIRTIFGGGAKIDRVPVLVVPDMPEPNVASEIPPKAEKMKGRLRVAFLSRITRKKNLDGALRMLSRGLRGEVEFNIYGNVDDAAYWMECQKIMRSLPGNIHARYAGSIEHSSVQRELMQNELFFLPTHGENFGHVVLEALFAGCNILISDRTPWLDLERQSIGWAVPLEQPDRFVEVLQQMIDMGPAEFAERSQRALEYGIQVSRDPAVTRDNRALFEHAVALQDHRRFAENRK